MNRVEYRYSDDSFVHAESALRRAIGQHAARNRWIYIGLTQQVPEHRFAQHQWKWADPSPVVLSNDLDPRAYSYLHGARRVEPAALAVNPGFWRTADGGRRRGRGSGHRRVFLAMLAIA